MTTPSLARIVRPWVAMVQYSKPKVIEETPEDLEAYIEWGEEAAFNYEGQPPDFPEDPRDEFYIFKRKIRYQFSEVDLEGDGGRVYNESNWFDRTGNFSPPLAFAHTESITFEGPDITGELQKELAKTRGPNKRYVTDGNGNSRLPKVLWKFTLLPQPEKPWIN